MKKLNIFLKLTLKPFRYLGNQEYTRKDFLQNPMQVSMPTCINMKMYFPLFTIESSPLKGEMGNDQEMRKITVDFVKWLL